MSVVIPVQGFTATMYAAMRSDRHTGHLKILIGAGANLNIQNHDVRQARTTPGNDLMSTTQGNTAAMCAAMYGHLAYLKMLVDAGIELNVRNNKVSRARQNEPVTLHRVARR